MARRHAGADAPHIRRAKQAIYCQKGAKLWNSTAWIWIGFSIVGTSKDIGNLLAPRPFDTAVFVEMPAGGTLKGVQFCTDGVVDDAYVSPFGRLPVTRPGTEMWKLLGSAARNERDNRRAFLLIASVIGLLLWMPAFASAADERHFFVNYVIATGGCGRITAYAASMNGPRGEVEHGQINYELFGKPAINWSDDDIATALRVYRDCEMKIGVRVQAPDFAAMQFKTFENDNDLCRTIMMARSLDASSPAF